MARLAFLVCLLFVAVATTTAHDPFEDVRFEVLKAPSSSSSSESSSSGSSYSSSLGSSFGSSLGSGAPIPPFSSSSSSRSSSSGSSSSESSSGGGDADEFKEELIQNMRMVAGDENSDKDTDLAEALQSVKDQIVYKANLIKQEKRWAREVTKIVEAYVKKARRVNAHIRQMQNEVKLLFRKKKQIENMIVQRKLEAKLKVAALDLTTVASALSNIHKKEDAFSKSKTDIKTTIGALRQDLQQLRGTKPKGSEESSSSSSSGSSSGSSQSSSSFSMGSMTASQPGPSTSSTKSSSSSTMS